MKLVLLGMIMLFLVGCKQQNIINFKPDASLLIPCPPMQQLQESDDGVVSMGDLLLSDIELAGQYRICQSRLDGWIESYKSYSKENK